MFQAASMLYVYVETPLHAGSGRGLGGVDLPIQRERVTGYPLVQASGMKGKLRAEAYLKKQVPSDPADGRVAQARTHGLEAIFGPEFEPEAHAGALAPGDARLLLFPVRSLAGVFAWTTSPDALARFVRDAAGAGVTPSWTVPAPAGGADGGVAETDVAKAGVTPRWTVPTVTGRDQVLVSASSVLKAGPKVVLEEFAFDPVEDPAVGTIATWLAANALPVGDEYEPWRQRLPQRLAILHDDAFRDFCQFGTEVLTRVRIDNATKTVSKGALWTEEALPSDSLLYTPLYASAPRANHAHSIQGGARGVLKAVMDLKLTRIQLGGDETVGRGLVSLRFGEVNDA